jgi:hypothetical protein
VIRAHSGSTNRIVVYAEAGSHLPSPRARHLILTNLRGNLHRKEFRSPLTDLIYGGDSCSATYSWICKTIIFSRVPGFLSPLTHHRNVCSAISRCVMDLIEGCSFTFKVKESSWTTMKSHAEIQEH